MSGALTAYSAVAGAANFLQTILLAPSPRMIGMIIPGCAIEERHLDRMIVTQHPVEVGAAISDHTYKVPSEVTLRWAWSDSPGGVLSPFLNWTGFGDGFVKTIYDKLLKLQASQIPFALVTGKKIYQQMIMTSLMITTDKDTEKSLMTTAVCQEVIMVQTSSVTSNENMSNPQQTGSVSSTGSQIPQPVQTGSSSPSLLVQARNFGSFIGLPSSILPPILP